jgi:hypothetical protein
MEAEPSSLNLDPVSNSGSNSDASSMGGGGRKERCDAPLCAQLITKAVVT